MAGTAHLAAPNIQEEVPDTCQNTRYDMARGLEHPSDHAGTIALVPQVVKIRWRRNLQLAQVGHVLVGVELSNLASRPHRREESRV
jgi:hypothetical protein